MKSMNYAGNVRLDIIVTHKYKFNIRCKKKHISCQKIRSSIPETWYIAFLSVPCHKNISAISTDFAPTYRLYSTILVVFPNHYINKINILVG